MHIDKTILRAITSNEPNVTFKRVYLKSEPDAFIRNDCSKKINDNLLQRILNNIQNTNIINRFFAVNSSQIDVLKEKYPHLDVSDIKEFVSKATSSNKNALSVMQNLEEGAKTLAEKYKENVPNVKSMYTDMFGQMDTVDSIGVRSKGEKSILSKLISKYSKGKIDSTDVSTLASKIGDGYGARIVLKHVDPQSAKTILSKALGAEMSYEEFVENIMKFDSLDDKSRKLVIKGLDKLKEAQTNEFVKKFINLIKKGSIELADDEFNNYGSEVTSYFSHNQLVRIAHAYEEKNKKPLTIVNKMDLNSLLKRAENVSDEQPKKSFFSWLHTNEKKAVKSSGYSTTQANIKTNYTTGEALADMELQVRGKRVNKFAEIEHVPYDIRQGKVTAPEYDEIRTIMTGMSEDSYKNYTAYLSDTYRYHRLHELGIESKKPELTQNLYWESMNKLPKNLKNTIPAEEKIDEKLISKITEEGLLALHEH